jgi:hypothetical protein
VRKRDSPELELTPLIANYSKENEIEALSRLRQSRGGRKLLFEGSKDKEFMKPSLLSSHVIQFS